MLRKNLEKVEPLGAEVIAPSHGPVYGRPQFIFDAYRDWVDGPPHNLVLIPFVTMHGSTKVMVDRLDGALVERGVKVERLDLQGLDLGRLATRAGRRRHHRGRGSHGDHPAAPAHGVGAAPGQRAEAEGPVLLGHGHLRLGDQGAWSAWSRSPQVSRRSSSSRWW